MFSKAQLKTVGRVTGPVDNRMNVTSNDVYLFDMATLVENGGGEIEPAFASYLLDFARQRTCYLISHAGYTDIMSCVPAQVRRAFTGIFAVSGTEHWYQDDLVHQFEHEFSDDLYEFVVKMVQMSGYPEKLAPSLDSGSASLGICLAGTNATRRQKRKYVNWELQHQELSGFMDEFRVRFPEYSICRDTDASLLITPSSFSPLTVRDHISDNHGSARIVGYVSQGTAYGFAKPLCQDLSGAGILSLVEGAGDVAQLLSYEKRRLSLEEQAEIVRFPLLKEI
ncbi:MAG: hypothetical protein AAGA50_14140 [Pseudomonadota bacterium]